MLRMLLHPAVMVFLIPIVAILCGSYIKTQKMRFAHEERLAKINAGIEPDDIDEDNLV